MREKKQLKTYCILTGVQEEKADRTFVAENWGNSGSLINFIYVMSITNQLKKKILAKFGVSSL